MRIAIIGSGISGLVVAYLLQREHEITVFESADRLGGHAHTVSVDIRGRSVGVDTGFVVFNETAYPNFTKLLGQLGVASQVSDMSFSVQCDETGLEYSSSSLDGLFAQRGNMFRPTFYRMLADIRRFYRESCDVLNGNGRYAETTLGDYLRQRRYSRAFIDQHIVPMGAAIWSAGPSQLESFPVSQFVRFFDNHQFLQMTGRAPWRTICGGSRTYVDAISRSFRDRVRLCSPVRSIRRQIDRVEVSTDATANERFDRVVLAVHSDQALQMLEDPSDAESSILGAIAYQRNDTVLHTDRRLLPTRERAWASWNYHRPRNGADRVTMTYCMNRLQKFESPSPYCVTLNRDEDVASECIIKRMVYHHPQFDSASFAAQKRWAEISGVERTHYCGAYWGYGFHEDGVRSALNVCEQFGLRL
ncbi:MAG: FAD-dependent oxidoreductase [Phycisphaerales bacterium]|nr:FAD-dependent oxidoreductase [Phycisphaerales bacterium]MCB9858570.1 FAD-dependent oxidoreductase [Phycisphaerales bacterium]